MEVFKLYSKNSFWLIIILVLLISVCMNIGLYFGINWLLLGFLKGSGGELVIKNISWVVKSLDMIAQNFYFGVIPAITFSLLFFGWLFWLLLRSVMKKTFAQIYMNKDAVSSKGKTKKDFVEQKIEQDRKRRLFLHTLSVFQREGRLLDFFDEDLKLYDDEQIGAAVRSVQEDCKKTIKKYIDLKPVIENEEGESITIETGFDIDSIKLVGKVAGEPPFKGVLKHRGWKAGKKEIPKLSDVRDSTIITPAEVEIQ